MTVQLQDSADRFIWTNVPAGSETLTAVTVPTVKRIAVSGPTGRYVRATGSISGTNPTFSDFSVYIVAKN